MNLPGLDVLTPREREVLVLIAEGMSLLDIAQTLHRSLKTIESHRLSLGKKLVASNRVELARIAIAHGLVTLPEVPAEQEHEHRRQTQDDPRAQAWADDITDRVYDRAGAEYLSRLTCALCDVLGVEYAGVCAPDEDDAGGTMYRALAYSVGGKIADQFSYEIANTPCDAAINAGYFQVVCGIGQWFSDDKPLLDLNAESFAGICLRSRAGEAVGVLWLLDTRPLEHAESVRNLLEHFGPRVAPVVVDIQQTRQALRLLEQRADQLEQANEDMRLVNDRLDQVADFYGKLTERMSDGLAVLNRQFQFIYVNKKYCEIAGVPRSELLGRSVEVVLTPEGREEFHARQPQRETDEMRHYETEFQRPDGERRRVLLAPRALQDEHGDFAGSFAVVTDLADIEHVDDLVNEKSQA